MVTERGRDSEERAFTIVQLICNKEHDCNCRYEAGESKELECIVKSELFLYSESNPNPNASKYNANAKKSCCQDDLQTNHLRLDW